jgi:ATP-dependent DNA ligase
VRRKRLQQVVGSDVGVLVSPQFDDGPALLAAARQQGLEGVVAKKADSQYKPGRRSGDWHKLKLRQTQEIVIAGYTRGQGRRVGGFGALVAGVHEAGVLRWAGNVGTGFSDREIERLRAVLKPLERPDSPFAETPKMPRVRGSGHRLGRAEARRRGRVRGVDARGAASALPRTCVCARIGRHPMCAASTRRSRVS